MGDDFIKVYSPTEGDECYVGYDAEEAIDALVEDGVPSLVVAVLDAHKAHVELQAEGCAALANLGGDVDATESIVATGGVDRIVAALADGRAGIWDIGASVAHSFARAAAPLAVRRSRPS